MDLDSPDGLQEQLTDCFDLSHRDGLHVRIEKTLAKIVCWNNTLFPRLLTIENGRRKYPAAVPGVYRCAIDILVREEGLKDFRPAKLMDKTTICNSLFKCLVQRFRRMAPNSLRLQHGLPDPEQTHAKKRKRHRHGRDTEKLVAVPKTPFLQRSFEERYALVEVEDGEDRVNFLMVLKRCFENVKWKASRFENELEREVFTLAQSEKKVFSELFHN